MKIAPIVALVCVLSLGATATMQSNNQTLKGHLVDTVCAKAHATEPKYVENHTRMCNLMDGCIKSGFSLVLADKRVLELDSRGNELALELSKSSRKEKDFRVTVSGTVSGATVAVSSMTLD